MLPTMKKPSERLSSRMNLSQKDVALSRKEQYELLRPYYIEESDRYEALNKRAGAYLSVVGAISVFAAFRSDSIAAAVLRTPLLTATAVAALISLLLCVLTVAYSLRVAVYKSPISPRDLVLAGEENDYTSNDTYSILLAGLVDAADWNRRQNDKRAVALQVALWFATIAVVLAVAANVAILYLSYEVPAMTKSPQDTTSAPAPASPPPGKTPMADLLNTSGAVPVKKGDEFPRVHGPIPDFTQRRPPSIKHR